MEFLIALFSIMMVNIVLSGDNAVVIALASRCLPPKQQKMAILWGSAGAIGLRMVLTLAAVVLFACTVCSICRWGAFDLDRRQAAPGAG